MTAGSCRRLYGVGLSALLGAVLIASAVLKIAAVLGIGAVETLSENPSATMGLSPSFTMAVSVCEALLGCALMCPWKRELWLSIAGALFLIMCLVVVWVTPPGGGAYSCGCFGDSLSLSLGHHLVLNGTLVLSTGLALILLHSKAPAPVAGGSSHG